LGIFDCLTAFPLFDADAAVPYTDIQAHCFIGGLPQALQIGRAHGPQILLPQEEPGQLDHAWPEAVELTGGIGDDEAFLFQEGQEPVRRALVQAQALADVRQAELRMLGIEAKENIDGLLD
jgi:hypothetical protein